MATQWVTIHCPGEHLGDVLLSHCYVHQNDQFPGTLGMARRAGRAEQPIPRSSTDSAALLGRCRDRKNSFTHPSAASLWMLGHAHVWPSVVSPDNGWFSQTDVNSVSGSTSSYKTTCQTNTSSWQTLASEVFLLGLFFSLLFFLKKKKHSKHYTFGNHFVYNFAFN